MRFLGSVVVVGALASAAVARAEPAAIVLPLTPLREIPGDLASAPRELSAAIAQLVGGEVSKVGLEEHARRAGCEARLASCQVAVARALKAPMLVFGTVAIGAERAVVVLTKVAAGGGEPDRRTFVLAAQTAPRLAKRLARVAAPMFDGKAPARDEPSDDDGGEVTIDVDREPAPVRAPRLAPRPDRRDREVREVRDEEDPIAAPLAGLDDAPARGPASPPGAITTGTYALIGGGLGGLAVGIGFHLSASGLRDDVEAAPRNTPLDFARLRELERAGQTRTTVGNVFLVGGALAAGAGVVRAILQRRAPREERASLAALPISGGATVVFSLRLP